MRTMFGVGLLVVCLGLAGCSVFGKKNSTADASSRNGSSRGVLARNDIPSESSGPPPGASGMLAGQVRDLDSRARVGVLIQVVDLQDAKSAPAKIEVEADKNGYFTIQGLQPGHHYQLVARVKDGEHLLSGSTIGTPPNPRMAIVMSEDFTTPATPQPPKPPALPDHSKGTKSGGPAATILPPRVDDDPRPAPAPESSRNVKDFSKIAADGVGDRTPNAPPVDMRYVPPPRPPTPPADEDPLKPTVPRHGGVGARDSSPSVVQTKLTPVPSCRLIGNKLDNLALYDLDGQAWEYKRDHRGRATLLEFGHSTCGPCLSTTPVLVGWQKAFGPAGLEIVSIFYEPGDRDQQVANVRATRGRYSINYTTLLGGQENCPVEQQFKVDKHPTLVLLDQTGVIVWRGTGFDAAQFRELEIEIRKRLERRP